MAIDIKEKGKVGCAYFVAEEGRLLCMEEVLGGSAELAEKRKILSLRRYLNSLLRSETRPTTYHCHPLSSVGHSSGHSKRPSRPKCFSCG